MPSVQAPILHSTFVSHDKLNGFNEVCRILQAAAHGGALLAQRIRPWRSLAPVYASRLSCIFVSACLADGCYLHLTGSNPPACCSP